MHDGKQVRTKHGGGSRKVDLPKSARKNDILEYAKDLFFPNGSSSKGKIINMKVDLKDFKNITVNETCTVEDFFNLTKLSHLRFYLSTAINVVGTPEISTTEHCTIEPSTIEPSIIEPSTTEPSTTEPSTPEPSTPEPSAAVENIIEVILLTDEEDQHLMRKPSSDEEDQYYNLMKELNRFETDEFPSPQTSISSIVNEIEYSHNYNETNSFRNTTEPLTDPKLLNITLRRGNVLTELINVFKTVKSMDIVLNIEMCLPNGSKEAGLDIGGVFRDALSEFWNEFYDRCTIGTTYKVPVISEEYNADMWKSIAKILYMGWKQVRYFPIKIAPVFMEYCLYGKIKTDLIQTFMNYLSTSESDVLRLALTSWEDVDSDTLIEILDYLQCKRIPNEENISNIMFDIAHKELIQKPKFIIDCWQQVIHGFIRNESLRDIYGSADATAQNVLKILQVEEYLTPEQSTIMSFLKKFIRESDSKELSNFLRFSTGADIITDNLIKIHFSSLRGVGRRPVAHTCSCILELPVAYINYPDFRSEMKSVISANVWVMDII